MPTEIRATTDITDLTPFDAVKAIGAVQHTEQDAIDRLECYLRRHVLQAVIHGGHEELEGALLFALDYVGSGERWRATWNALLGVLVEGRKAPTLEKGLALVQTNPAAEVLLRRVEGAAGPVKFEEGDTDASRREVAALKALESVGLVLVRRATPGCCPSISAVSAC